MPQGQTNAGKTTVFTDLQAQIKKALAEDMLQAKISIPQLMALLEVFAIADNEIKLRMLLQMLNDQAPSLQVLTEKQEHQTRLAAEQSAQELVSLLTKIDPQKAAMVAELATKPNFDLEKLLDEQPELRDLLNQ